MGSKEEFDKAKLSADELASSIRDIVFEGRDLTDEVKKLTKGLYGVSERAAQINKTFRDKHLDSLDKDWNNLYKHSLEDIKKTYFEHIKTEYWKKEETLPECCGNLCRIKK